MISKVLNDLWHLSYSSNLILYPIIPVSLVAQLVKNLRANAGDSGDSGSIPGIRRIPWRRKWQPIPAFLPGKSHGQGILVAYTPWGYQESDMTKSMEDTKEATHINCLLEEEQEEGSQVAEW